MDGTIINFDGESKSGVIRAEDKKRYRFSLEDWGSPGEPRQSDIVDFEPVDDRATEIYVTNRVAEAGPIAPSPVEAVVTPSVTEVPKDGQPVLGSPSASISTPSLAMPSGLGARFFIAYFITMVPTYVLPYLGSNSAVFNGLAAGAVGSFSAQFWWHFSCFPVLIFLAYVRAVRISRPWLTAFPVIAGFFDLMPGFNFIPLVPTVMHFAALFVGSSRSAPEGYAPTDLNTKIEYGLWGIAAASAFSIYKVMTLPYIGSGAGGFANSILLWPVFGLAVFFAIKYHAGEGANILEVLTAQFNGGSSAADAHQMAVDQGVVMDPPASLAKPTPDPATPSAQVFCSECGIASEPGAKFCGECGGEI